MNHANVNEISCREALTLIAEYLDNELGTRDRVQLERHLDTCRHCYDRVEFERLLKARLAQLRETASSDALHQRINTLLDRF
jgi:anti-sigma factor (TIGR02949 family)